MECYLIQSPEEIDANETFNELGIEATNDFSCINCYISELEPWQVTELTGKGFIVFRDSMCRL